MGAFKAGVADVAEVHFQEEADTQRRDDAEKSAAQAVQSQPAAFGYDGAEWLGQRLGENTANMFRPQDYDPSIDPSYFYESFLSTVEAVANATIQSGYYTTDEGLDATMIPIPFDPTDQGQVDAFYAAALAAWGQ